ncbi:hypothetical protein QFZ80_001287 [Paenibacillus sp. V4I7]|nr:hypothetical protein [Paenibacillus sp. V4I7]MDQ0897390.1 hypothetical protein [Paenibacillus sp. V4I7]MDQ0897459.1 hypothetical protein [Paenibacillus sp. V4I7]
MLAHSQDFNMLVKQEFRCLGSVGQAVPLVRMREQKVLNIFTTSSIRKVMLHASLHKVLGDSLSQISTGLCPHIPSSYLSKVWSPINVNGTGLCPKA